jgi:hypothetical protein
MKFTFGPESKPLDGFTIKRAIHRGGFGEVYYALTDAGKEVALKLLHNNLEVELRGVAQCLNLKHPNLVTIFDMKQDNEKDHWIVMEYVGGKGLYDVLQQHPAGLPLNEVLSWLSGMTAGLSFLHDRGIVHRDLKPANVFSESGVVKIGDVGLSKYISESRRSAQTQSVGTVYYMAPEVARGRYGREVDVYSLGVILYEMITGRVPFEGETTAEILMKHLMNEPDLSVLPDRLRPVIGAALEKDPNKRISDVEELERRFRIAIQESGFAVDKPAPVRPRAVSSSPRSASAMATTLLGSPAGTAKGPVERWWQSLATLWNEKIPTPVKWIIIGAALLALLDEDVLEPIAKGGVVGYLAYLGWRKWIKTPETVPATSATSAGSSVPATAARPVEPAVAAAPQVAVAGVARKSAPPVPQPVPRTVRIYSPATARKIPGGQRTVDLTSSLSLALVSTALVTAAVHLATDLIPEAADIAFFGGVTLLASWTLIVPAKMWEGRPGDALYRRLIQSALGAGIGAVAFVLQQYLMLVDTRTMLADRSEGALGGQLGRIALLDPSGLPTIAGFMTFFGVLFFARRWWWQADSFRKTRFRTSSALVTLLVGVILTALMPFPQLLGATWALAISAVVQLSSGWTPTEDRFLRPASGEAVAPPLVMPAVHPVVATAAAAAAAVAPPG